MDIIIPRNSKIPTRATNEYKTFKDNQRIMTIGVYEGERAMVKGNNFLGEFELKGIPPAPRGVQLVDVTIDVDVNGIINVSALCKSTNNEMNLTITNDMNRFSKEDIVGMIEDAAKFRFEEFCYCMKMKVEDAIKFDGKISDAEKELIWDKCNDQIKWLDSNPKAEKVEYARRLKDPSDFCNPIISKLHKRARKYKNSFH